MSTGYRPQPKDLDKEIEYLRVELRTTMAALNMEHHPVHPPREDRVAALEKRVAELKADIAERREELRRLQAAEAQEPAAE